MKVEQLNMYEDMKDTAFFRIYKNNSPLIIERDKEEEDARKRQQE